jgi:alpha-amylase/alpha-mannosidase (GH57 family)
MNRQICIHGHFYQPSRENPWLEDIELQDAAYPYHDWNERITAECYALNSASRILDPERRIIDIVNNYTKISFDFGPTLLSWLERYVPEVYQAVIEADRESQKSFSGHGSAIAQAYNHIIMPLANRRDKRTQVIWGIRDFTHRFGREPEGMWLPETAVDLETLDILAECGMKFTVLAPHQAKRVRKLEGKKWEDVSGARIDPKMPYLCRLPSGRTISLFFYDSPISHDVAFGDLLNNGENFAKRLDGAFSQDQKSPQLVHIATDGETYGHHHRFADMALAYCLYFLESQGLAGITIYGEYLEKHPPTHEVEISENSSWSCVHGVERWRSNCGCNTGMHPGWSQQWRAPLREAMDWLRDALIPIYEGELARYLHDPWVARENYIEVILDRSARNLENYFSRHARSQLSREDKVTVLKLLEIQRHAMSIYTSCGWFFDEITGIESVQILKYAARNMQLARDVSGTDLEPAYLKIMERALSNIPKFKNGARVYEMLVKPTVVDLLRVGSHYAVSSLFEEYNDTMKVYCYTADSEVYSQEEAGKLKLAIGRARMFSEITWEEDIICFAVLHFGEHNLSGGVREYMEEESFEAMRKEINKAFTRSDVTEVIHLIEKHFGTHNYSIWHLFKDKRREVLNQVLESELEEIEKILRQIYEDHYPLMKVMEEMRVPLPRAINLAVEFIINSDLRKLLEAEELDLDQLQKLMEEVRKWSFGLDKTTLEFVANRKIHSLMERLSGMPQSLPRIEETEGQIRILHALPLELNLWKAQNIYFSMGKEFLGKMREKAEGGDEDAKKWLEHFNSLGHHLNVGIK